MPDPRDEEGEVQMTALVSQAAVRVVVSIPFESTEWLLSESRLAAHLRITDELTRILTQRGTIRADLDPCAIKVGRLQQTHSDGALRKVVDKQYVHLLAFYALAKRIHASEDESLKLLALYGITGYVLVSPIYQPLAVTLSFGTDGRKQERWMRLRISDSQTFNTANGVVWLAPA